MDIRNLIGHLDKEAALFKELISILQKETENLVTRDYKGLYETVSQKEHLAMRISALGRTRQDLLSKAAIALGCCEGSAATLSSVIERAGLESGALEDCRKSILSLTSSVKEINSLNSLVAGGSLDNINKTLGFLGNFLQTSVYKPTGAFAGFAVKGSRLSEGA